MLVVGGGKSDVRLCHAVQAVDDALPNAERRTLTGQTHNVSMKVLAPLLEESSPAEAALGQEPRRYDDRQNVRRTAWKKSLQV
jgi:hypothetical protein